MQSEVLEPWKKNRHNVYTVPVIKEILVNYSDASSDKEIINTDKYDPDLDYYPEGGVCVKYKHSQTYTWKDVSCELDRPKFLWIAPFNLQRK